MGGLGFLLWPSLGVLWQEAWTKLDKDVETRWDKGQFSESLRGRSLECGGDKVPTVKCGAMTSAWNLGKEGVKANHQGLARLFIPELRGHRQALRALGSAAFVTLSQLPMLDQARYRGGSPIARGDLEMRPKASEKTRKALALANQTSSAALAKPESLGTAAVIQLSKRLKPNGRT
ncbi:hypothetical protein EJ06DRAFT_523234 [Trichodelitschia bisporula]|uniref:Uncharacterized protein n=1 Tax=Trichodelitschia bisporula TaxID=703511 RepID=A0A6G1HR77_9PEZI|nr:hypothetical protein EJ06DRAFT_523234 [Trichodelitschia bisporula]